MEDNKNINEPQVEENTSGEAGTDKNGQEQEQPVTIESLMADMAKLRAENAKNKLAAALIKKDIYGLKAMFDAGEVGGTALLGISRPVIKAHGSSDARAIRSAVNQAITFINAGVIQSIENNIQYMRITGNEGE